MHDFFNRDILGYYRENSSWIAKQIWVVTSYGRFAVYNKEKSTLT